MTDNAEEPRELPNFLQRTHKSDYPHIHEVRRRSLLTRAVRELDPVTRDIDYSGGKETMRENGPMDSLAANIRETVQRSVDESRRIVDVPRLTPAPRERPVPAACSDNRIDVFADMIVNQFTYGELMEIAVTITSAKNPDYKPPAGDFEFAALMHRWAKAHLARRLRPDRRPDDYDESSPGYDNEVRE